METRYKKNLAKPRLVDGCTQTMLSIHPEEPLFINKRKVNNDETSDYIITENPSSKKRERYYYDENYDENYDKDYIPPSNINDDECLSEMSFIVDTNDENENESENESENSDSKIEDYESTPKKALRIVRRTSSSSSKRKTVLVIPLKFPFSSEDKEHGLEASEFACEEQDDNIDVDKDEKKTVKLYESSLSKEEKKYFRTLDDSERQLIIQDENYLADINCTKVPLRFKILSSSFDKGTKAIALSKINLMNKLDASNGEKFKLMNYVESLCKIPIGICKKLPVESSSSKEEILNFITNTYSFFNNKIYGHNDAKEQIIRILAQWISNPQSKGNVIGIHGNPGVGKTTLVKECICNALDIPFQFIPLGGASDASYIEGHSYTYEGSTWGKIVDSLIKAKCMNPVLYFDELDKVSDTPRGQEIINLLIHITDPSQNDSFYDKYFSDFPLDLSKCLIIFTYNNDSILNPILKDRMIRISTKDYNNNDKLVISNKYLIPDLLKQFGFGEFDILFDDNVIEYINKKTEKESGVRNLKRALELLISNVNLTRMINIENKEGIIGKCFTINQDTQSILPLKITCDIVDYFIKDKVVNDLHSHIYL